MRTIGPYIWIPFDKVGLGKGSKHSGYRVTSVGSSHLIPRYAISSDPIRKIRRRFGHRRRHWNVICSVIGNAIPIVREETIAIAFKRWIPFEELLSRDVVELL